MSLAQLQPRVPRTRPIRMMMAPTSAGGGTDIIARIAAQRLNVACKQPVIIDSRGGGDMRTAPEAPADDYPLLTGNVDSIVISASLFKPTSYVSLRDCERHVVRKIGRRED